MFNFPSRKSLLQSGCYAHNLPSDRQIDFRHNPYIGIFFNGSRSTGLNSSSNLLPNSSPYIGTFRHSPSSSIKYGGLKDILRENCSGSPVLSQMQISRKNRYAYRHVNPEELAASSVFQSSPLLEDDIPCCAICLEVFVDGDEIRVLECDHCFHKSCIDIWLLGSLSEESTDTSGCPTCRRAVLYWKPYINGSNTPTSPDGKKNRIETSSNSSLIMDLDAHSGLRDTDVDSCSAQDGISLSTYLEIGAILHAGEGCRSPSNDSICSHVSEISIL